MTRAEVRDQLWHFICSSILRTTPITVTDDEPLISGGIIDSFALAHIAVFIESAFGVCIPDIDLTKEKLDTLGQMVDRVLAQQSR